MELLGWNFHSDFISGQGLVAEIIIGEGLELTIHQWIDILTIGKFFRRKRAKKVWNLWFQTFYKPPDLFCQGSFPGKALHESASDDGSICITARLPEGVT